jgi:isopentenyl-diphosphate delta-isomerase
MAEQNLHIEDHLTAENRKSDHIALAFQSQVDQLMIDKRFSYEPLLSAHPPKELFNFPFLGKQIQAPIWVSSMTGGTEKSYQINQNLAKACAHFKMGMGLGSCRSLLESNDRLKDFDFRKIIGDDLPFYANIGIAQLSQLIQQKKHFLIDDLIKKLDADGIIIHVNPLQEWLQPEGDAIEEMPILTIKKFIDLSKQKIIVKEVGQGMGKASLRELVQLPIQAIEFAAHGGTNFSKLELLRTNEANQAIFSAISSIGHSADEMVSFVNELITELGDKFIVQNFIISGGIKNFLDGHYLMQKLGSHTAVYGQASALLKYAENNYDELHQYIENQIKGLQLSKSYFKVI